MAFGYQYEDLQEAVSRELGGAIPSPDLIPQWIRFAETWCQRNLDLDCFRASISGTIEQGATELSLPDDYESFRSLQVVDNSDVHFVDLVSPDRVACYSTTESGRPEVCFNAGTGLLGLRPMADADYPYTLLYKKWLEPLSGVQPSNALIEGYFDLLFYRTLLYSAPYLYEDPRLNTWAALLQELTEDIRLDQWRRDNPHRFRSSRIAVEPF